MKSSEAQAYWQPLNLAALFKRRKKEEHRRKSVCKWASLAPLTPNACISTLPSSLLLCHCICSWSTQNESCFHHFLLGRYWIPFRISSLEVPSLTPRPIQTLLLVPEHLSWYTAKNAPLYSACQFIHLTLCLDSQFLGQGSCPVHPYIPMSQHSTQHIAGAQQMLLKWRNRYLYLIQISDLPVPSIYLIISTWWNRRRSFLGSFEK